MTSRTIRPTATAWVGCIISWGNCSQAVTELEKAASEKKPDPVILDHLGDAYLKNGQPDKAQSDLAARRAARSGRRKTRRKPNKPKTRHRRSITENRQAMVELRMYLRGCAVIFTIGTKEIEAMSGHSHWAGNQTQKVRWWMPSAARSGASSPRPSSWPSRRVAGETPT